MHSRGYGDRPGFVKLGRRSDGFPHVRRHRLGVRAATVGLCALGIVAGFLAVRALAAPYRPLEVASGEPVSTPARFARYPSVVIRTVPPPPPIPSVGGAGTGMGGGCGSGPVHDLIAAAFPPGELDQALYVADRESGCNPAADNPTSSAAGVFQIVAGTWGYWSGRCGYPGASPYDAGANVAVAACMVAAEGWGPWAL